MTSVKDCSNSNTSDYANGNSEDRMYPPELSKWNSGNAKLASHCEYWMKRYIGSVFLPIYPIIPKTFLLLILCISFGTKERNDNANIVTAKSSNFYSLGNLLLL